MSACAVARILAEIANRDRNLNEVKKAVQGRPGNVEHELGIAKVRKHYLQMIMACN